MLKLLLKMQFKGYNLFYTIIVCFLSLSCLAQPGLQGDLTVNIDTKKYTIEAYNFSRIDSLNNLTQLVKLKTQYHPQQQNCIAIKFITEKENLLAENILLIVSNKNKKMMVIITGELNPYENYVLDIDKVFYAFFSINIKKDNTKIHNNRMGKDLTPIMEEIK